MAISLLLTLIISPFRKVGGPYAMNDDTILPFR